MNEGWGGVERVSVVLDHVSCRSLAFTGLALISLGTGGIKPCVSAFGGDQFKEEQVRPKGPLAGRGGGQYCDQSALPCATRGVCSVAEGTPPACTRVRVLSAHPPIASPHTLPLLASFRNISFQSSLLFFTSPSTPAVSSPPSSPPSSEVSGTDQPLTPCNYPPLPSPPLPPPSADVQCFGGDCYALAFGVPAILMFVSLGECAVCLAVCCVSCEECAPPVSHAAVVFVLGSPFYTISRPKCGRFYDIIIFKFAITVFVSQVQSHTLHIAEGRLCITSISSHAMVYTSPPFPPLPPLPASLPSPPLPSPSQLTIYQCVVLLVRKVLSCLKREKTWTPHSSVFSLAERKYGVSLRWVGAGGGAL